jgi:mRNA-degrading endonuclease RelE of RelBE toxin-antitoxin system
MSTRGEPKRSAVKDAPGGTSNGVFEVKLTPQAERAYRHLDATTRSRVDRVLAELEQGAFSHRNIRALHGPYAGSLRYRLSGWRIVFRVDHAQRVVWIEAITTRGGAYR